MGKNTRKNQCANKVNSRNKDKINENKVDSRNKDNKDKINKKKDYNINKGTKGNKLSNFTKSDKIFWRVCIVICTVMVMALTIYLANKDMPIYKQDDAESTYAKAEVVKVYNEKLQSDKKTEYMKKGFMEIQLKILSGRYKDETYKITHNVSVLYNVVVKEGDIVSVRIDERNDGEHEVSIYNYYRTNSIIMCLVVFALVLIVIGGFKGLKALIGLIFTIISIIWILLPLTLKGYSPVIVTLSVVLVATVVSLVLIDGWSRKTVVAIVGTMGGILVGMIFALIATRIMHVTTYQMEEAESLLLVNQSLGLKVKNLFLCSILISCMGAVMDVAMSISSAIEELKTLDAKIEAKKLFASAMNIGRDAMGTMANTLILAFAGSSLNMMILLYSYGISFEQLFNTDFVAIEIISAIAGSIGIIAAVPLVSFVGAYIGNKKAKGM